MKKRVLLAEIEGFFYHFDYPKSYSSRIVNSENSNFPLSKVHNKVHNRIANVLKIIG